MRPTGLAAWEVYADVVLQREALAMRIRRGEPPRPLAGLVIDNEEIAGLLAELPGLADRDGTSLDALMESTREDVTEAEAALVDSSRREPFDAIVWNAGLDPISARLLAIAVAVELDVARQRLVAYLNDDVSRRWLTLAVVGRVLGPEGLDRLTNDSLLVRACLVSIAPDALWVLGGVKVAPAVVTAIAGLPTRDDDLPQRCRVVEVDDNVGGDFVLVHGGDSASRVDSAAAATAGQRFMVTSMPIAERGWQAIVRQCMISGLSPIFELGNHRTLDDDQRWWIERLSFLSIAVCSQAELTLDTVPDRPFHELRADSSFIDLGGGHLLDREQARLVEKALLSVGDDPDAAVRRLVTGQLDVHADRTTPGRQWDELVLPDDQMSVLRELVARYRHRHRVFREWGFPARPSVGVTALFSGPSGTGKTMTAEIIASELGLDLYRIDLSAVVSKYIGETEKNLEEIFTASAAGNLVLFFDEADALFGKRSEVGDAHDRYANIEVAYLLQRLERYDGFVILATNLRKNIDAAFLRRIDVALEFELPETARRQAIWERVFPTRAPIGLIDHRRLAEEFEVSGGAIRNAAVHAAFLAADDGSAIEMRHVVAGMQREYQKMGRLRGRSDAALFVSLEQGVRSAASA